MSNIGLINIGQQGLKAYQSALSVTGQNITNVNTPGYSRQEVAFESRTGSGSGSGVTVSDIRRISDSHANRQLWSDTATFGYQETLAFKLGQLDNMLADPQTGISTALDQFFSALQTTVDDASSQPNRQLLYSQTEALTRRFQSLDGQIQSQFERSNRELESYASTLNELSQNIAGLNRKIQLTSGEGGKSNDLFDQRDEQVRKLSELVDVTVVEDADEMLNVFIGKGQQLVVGTEAGTLVPVAGKPDPSQLGLAMKSDGGLIDFTDDISGGKLGGLLNYRDEILVPARNELGRVAIAFADSLNQQHRVGMDLNGNLGSELFQAINHKRTPSYAIQASGGNSVATVPSLQVSDATQLIDTDYSIDFSGGNVSVTRSGDGSTAQGPVAYTAGMTLSFDGLEVNLDAAATVAGSAPTFADGDSFSVTIQQAATQDRIVPASDNSVSGNTWLEISDPSALTGSDYLVEFSSASTFNVVRLSDNQQFAFAYPQDHAFTLDGMTVTLDMPTTGTTPPVPGADIAPFQTGDSFLLKPTRTGAADIEVALGSPNDLALANPVRGLTDRGNSGSGLIQAIEVTDPDAPLFLANPGQLTLPDQAVPGVPGQIEVVFNAPDGSGQATFDVYDITDPSNPRALDLGSGAMTGVAFDSPQQLDLGGFAVTLGGQPQPGDRFRFEYNAGGTTDNRNALAMSEQQLTQNIGNYNFQEAYASIIEGVGTQANVAQINRDASEVILTKSTELRDSISGVNLDEEAARLLQFEQAYNASAQVISIARSLFDTLLNTMR